MDGYRAGLLCVCLGFSLLYLTNKLAVVKDEGVEVDVVEQVNATGAVETVKRMKAKRNPPERSELKHHQSKQLEEMFEELETEATMCVPSDITNEAKHRPPKIASKTMKMNEPRAVLVVYVAVGLLLTSLGAAILDFFRAKNENAATAASDRRKNLTRRCSLADLTVLRHDRRAAADAAAHQPRETVQRAPPPSISRRCSLSSLPHELNELNSTHASLVGGAAAAAGSGTRIYRRTSSIETDGSHEPNRHKHYRLFRRH